MFRDIVLLDYPTIKETLRSTDRFNALKSTGSNDMNGKVNRTTTPFQTFGPRGTATTIQDYLGFISDITMAAGLIVVLAIQDGISAAVGLQAGAVFIGLVAVIVLLQRHYRVEHKLGPADRVTLMRSAIAAFCAGLLFHGVSAAGLGWWLPIIAGTALVLDGVDGWLARRTGTASAFGARFDMETDAFFILVLSALVWQLGKAGPWILVIGAMRYLLLAAAMAERRLGAELPPSRRRQVVCVVQVATLALCLLPVTTSGAATVIAAAAAVALAYSFTVDIVWLLHRP